MKFEGDKRREIFANDDDYCYQIGIEMYKEMVDSIPVSMMVHKFNMVALLLNISDSALEQATQIYKDLESSRSITGTSDRPIYEYPEGKQNNFFNFTEKYFISLIFAVSAVEAYVNSLIKNDINIELPSTKGAYKNFSIYDIELQIDLREKIKKILPASREFDIKTEEMPFWNDFCDLIKFRNEIVHPKSEKITVVLGKDRSIKYIKSSQIKILNDIYHAGRNKELVKSARKVIEYLAKKTAYPEVTPLEFRNYEPANMMDYVRQNKINIEYED